MVEWLGRYAQFRGIGPIYPGRGGGYMGTTSLSNIISCLCVISSSIKRIGDTIWDCPLP